MSMMAAFGAAPSNFTTPMIVPAVAGSVGVAGAAGAAAPGAPAGGIASCFHRGRSVAARDTRAAHRGPDPPLFFRGELEDVIHQQLGLIFIIALERGRRRTRKDPVIVLPLEQTGRHGGAWADGLWVDDPALHPIGFQAATGLQEV